MIKTILIFFFIAVAPLFQPSQMGYTEILSKYFTRHPGTYVAVPSFNKQRKLVVDNYSLYKYYLKHNHTGDIVNYQDFLKATFEKGISFKARDLEPYEYEFSHYFVNEKLNILKEYQSKGINFIITKYLTRLEQGEFRNKVIDDDTLHGLIYIMSTNKYIVSLSGYSGYHQFVTVEKISEKIKSANRLK